MYKQNDGIEALSKVNSSNQIMSKMKPSKLTSSDWTKIINNSTDNAIFPSKSNVCWDSETDD